MGGYAPKTCRPLPAGAAAAEAPRGHRPGYRYQTELTGLPGPAGLAGPGQDRGVIDEQEIPAAVGRGSEVLQNLMLPAEQLTGRVVTSPGD